MCDPVAESVRYWKLCSQVVPEESLKVTQFMTLIKADMDLLFHNISADLPFTNLSYFYISFSGGHWAIWGKYGACSVTCGNGTKIRSRACVDGLCSGITNQTGSCVLTKCK